MALPYRSAPELLEALKIVQPEALIRCHRTGFRACWRGKSRPRGGRANTPADIRRLIHEMSVGNPLWGAPRIHGELLKLGINVGQTTVGMYVARGRSALRRRPERWNGREDTELSDRPYARKPRYLGLWSDGKR